MYNPNNISILLDSQSKIILFYVSEERRKILILGNKRKNKINLSKNCIYFEDK